VSSRRSLSDTFGGTIEIIMGRASGLARIDLSVDGFWISFYGLLLAGLVDASAYSITHASGVTVEPASSMSRLGFIGISLLIDLLSYVVSMTALFLMAQRLGLERGFLATATIHNWAAAIVSVAFLPLYLMLLTARENAYPEGPGTFWIMFYILLVSLLVVVGIRLIRIGLQTSFGKALGLFAVSATVSLTMESWLSRLFHLS